MLASGPPGPLASGLPFGPVLLLPQPPASAAPRRVVPKMVVIVRVVLMWLLAGLVAPVRCARYRGHGSVRSGDFGAGRTRDDSRPGAVRRGRLRPSCACTRGWS